MCLQNSSQPATSSTMNLGHVYIMTHSIFSDVIKIGCTYDEIHKYTRSLSQKGPGHYYLFFSMLCSNPCQIKSTIKKHFEAQQYINEFYTVEPDIARKTLKREAMKIPIEYIN